MKWLAVGLGVLLSLLVIGLAVYARTEHFSLWARAQALQAINESIRGTISFDRLEGSVWGHLTLYDVSLRHAGEEVAALPRVEVAFSLWPLIWGRVQIARLDAVGPRATLIQNEAGEWNIIEALAARGTEPETPTGRVVSVNSLTVSNGDVSLRPGGAAEEFYRFQDFNLRGDLGMRPAGLRISVDEVAGLFTAPNQPALRLKGSLAYQQSGAAPAVLSVKDFWAVSRSSQIKLNGQLTQDDPLRIKARAELPKLAASDIARYVPGWPIKHDFTGKAVIDGPLDRLNGDVELAAAGAKLTGKFQADLLADVPRYTTMLKLSGMQLQQWLEDRNLSGVVNGTVEGRGKGFALRDIAAQASLEVRNAAAHGWALGHVSLNGRLANSVAALTGELKSELGRARWSGEITLDDKPVYQVNLAVENLDVQKALPDGDAITGSLNLRGAVKGAGLSPANMDARAEIQILPSTLGPVQLKGGEVTAQVSGRKIRVARAALSTAETTLDVAGEIGLDAGHSGKLDYRLRVADVSPWLSLVERKGSGSLNLTGRAQGNLADLSTEGSAQLSRLYFDGVTVMDGSVKFILAGSQEQMFPEGTVNARLSGVDAGVSLGRVDASAKLARQPVPSIDLQMSAQDSAARKHGLDGLVEITADAIVTHLRQAEVGSPVGTWSLVNPATVTQRGGGLFIEGVTMRSAGREVSLNGRLGWAGAQDLSLRIDRFPLETVAAWFPDDIEITGMLAVEGRITGTAAAPEIAALARLSDSSIAGQAYQGARAELKYQDNLASLNVAVHQDATHTLTGNGTLPIRLSWHEGWRAEVGDDLAFTVKSAGISLAFLNAFSGEAVQKIGGEIALDLQARGSIKQPDLRGTFELRDGQASILPLGIEVAPVTAAGSLDARKLVISQLYARAKDGEIRGSGSLSLDKLDRSEVRLLLSAKRWPALDTERYRVRVGGEVQVQGSAAAPKVSGKLTVNEGTLRPDLAFLERSDVPLQRDETIVIVKNKRPVRSPQALAKETPAKDGWFEKITLNLDVDAPGNLWIRHPDLVAELSGKVAARKAPGSEIDLSGRIALVRGWMAFQGRRFQLTRGVVEFTGGDKIAPALDFVAQYRVQGYQVQVLVGGTTEKPVLTLSSEPRLEQADILALLVFGKRLDALNQHEQGSLQQSALNITSGFIAAGIAQSVSQALGLDALGLDLGDVSFSGGRIGFGRYIGPGTYISVSQQLSGEQGQEVALEYRITPDWTISSSTTSAGSSGIDLIWHKRY